MSASAPERYSGVMRVLYVHNGCDLYGASRSLLRLVCALDGHSVEPHVLLPAEGRLAGALRDAGVSVTIEPGLAFITRPVLKSWRMLPFLLKVPFSVLAVRREIRRRGIDLVHTNTGVVVSSGAAARLAKVPHVWHVRDSFRDFGALWALYRRYVTLLSDTIVCVSRSVADQFGGEGGKVIVVHNGLPDADLEPPDPSAVEAFRRTWRLDGKRVVGLVGRIKLGRKGHDVLVRAAARFVSKFDDLRLLFVGTPFPGNEQHLAELKALVHSLGLDDRCVFTGDVDDVRPAYACMDALVVPSCDPEPFAGVVLEAMALGVPVIGSRIGGTVEQIEDGVSGLLTTPGDDEELAATIERVLLDEDLRSRLASAARQRVRQRFPLSRTCAEIVGLYRALMSAERPRAQRAAGRYQLP